MSSPYTELDAAKNEQEAIKAKFLNAYGLIHNIVTGLHVDTRAAVTDALCDIKQALDFAEEDACADAYERQCEAEREIEAIEARADRLQSPVVL